MERKDEMVKIDKDYLKEMSRCNPLLQSDLDTKVIIAEYVVAIILIIVVWIML